ncbi:MAG: hypothetical protein IJ565_02520 [Bacilli bacterium]|nr:hypothetical protein [Bacilli bacterium]
MAYSKRIPPIKIVLTIKEYNTLIGVLTENSNSQNDEIIKNIALLTKEKLLKYSVPRNVNENIEIDIRLYINEAVDIISQFLTFTNLRLKEIDYYQVLLKVRENIGDLTNENVSDNDIIRNE